MDETCSSVCRRSACREMHKASEAVHSCQSVCWRGSFSEVCFSTSVCSWFYSCRLPLVTGRGSSHSPVVSASEQTAALRSGAPRVVTLAPLQAGFAGHCRWWPRADWCGGGGWWWWWWHTGCWRELMYTQCTFFFFFQFLATVSSNRNLNFYLKTTTSQKVKV